MSNNILFFEINKNGIKWYKKILDIRSILFAGFKAINFWEYSVTGAKKK